MALQADGKIVAVGATAWWQRRPSDGDFALARYNPNGSLDTTFSGDGKQTTDFGGIGGRFGEGATGVAAPANGKIVAVGTADESGISHFALARYNTDGTLDASFSGDGKQASKFGGSDVVNGVALQPDGKIVTVGATSFGVSGFSSQGAFALARYNANGSPDLSFSGDGRQTSGFADGASGVALQSDGKIVAVGTDDVPGDDADGGDFALGRYNPNGSLDPTFSGDGKQTTDFGPFDQASGVAIQANGKIVVVGDGGSGGANDFALARYNANGSLDTSFSGTASRRPTSGAPTGRAEWRSRRTARSSWWGPVAPARTWSTTTSPSPATTPTARSTPPSPGTASRPPTSGASADPLAKGQPGWRSRRTARSSLSGRPAAPTPTEETANSRSPATTPTARSTRASPVTASRRPNSGGTTRQVGWRSRREGRSSSRGPAASTATSPSPATTRTARSIRPSPETAGS